MAGMIGASLEDLQVVAKDFGFWSSEARDSGSTVVTTVESAISTLEAETTRAQTTCIEAIGGMKDVLGRVHAVLLSADYVGQNADTAREASSDMEAKATQTEAEMTSAFDEFRTQITALGESLGEIARSYDTYAAAASESGESMVTAMETQRSSLEAAMTGMSYGG